MSARTNRRQLAKFSREKLILLLLVLMVVVAVASSCGPSTPCKHN